MRLLPLLLPALLGLAPALAYPAGTLYVPLDDRPPNWSPCAWGLVTCPPPEIYKGRDGADPAALNRWLLDTRGERLVVSLDAVAYGGLVQSRISPIPVQQAKARLAILQTWKARYGGEVFAFGVIPRHPDATNRARNLELLRAPGEGYVYFEAPWDDALPGSPAIAEAATLAAPTRPGADEAGQVLILRALNAGARVKVVYTDPKAAAQVTRYDGIPLSESVGRMIRSAGATAVEDRPDFSLVVYSGGDPRQGTLAVLRALREGPVAVADIARVNRGDPSLVRYLVGIGVYADLAAYASWGTPGNNIGAALAQGGLFTAGRCQRSGWGAAQCEETRQKALAQAYLEYLWGEIGRPWVRERFPEPLTEEAARYAFDRLKAEPTPEFALGRLEVTGLEFPWRRSFEAEWRYDFGGAAAEGR